jgi:hypothetical protein
MQAWKCRNLVRHGHASSALFSLVLRKRNSRYRYSSSSFEEIQGGIAYQSRLSMNIRKRRYLIDNKMLNAWSLRKYSISGHAIRGSQSPPCMFYCQETRLRSSLRGSCERHTVSYTWHSILVVQLDSTAACAMTSIRNFPRGGAEAIEHLYQKLQVAQSLGFSHVQQTSVSSSLRILRRICRLH